MICDCNTHSRLWYPNFITILSFDCPKLACIELLISLPNDRHLFADGFVTVRPIAMKFRWNKESVSSLKFWKFHLNPSNFNRKLTMMFKLDLKTMTFTAFRTPVQNGLMQKVNIFCTENEHLHAFYAPTKNRTNWIRSSCWFLCLKKIGHYFWRRVYNMFHYVWMLNCSWINTIFYFTPWCQICMAIWYILFCLLMLNFLWIYNIFYFPFVNVKWLADI